MNKTFRISFSLKNTYRVNCLIYALKQVPILKKILPESLYRSRGLKVVANILSILWEINMAFLGKLVYFLFVYAVAANMYEALEPKQLFLHTYVFLTIMGSFTNTYMFNPTKDKYYGMIFLRMNAREYTLTNYLYALLKIFLGFLIFGMIFGLACGLSVWQCLLLPFFTVGLKVSVAAYSLGKYEKSGVITNENKLGKYGWFVLFLLLAVAYGLPAIELFLPEMFCIVFMILSAVAGVFSVRKILTFAFYREVYKELLTPGIITEDVGKQAVKEQQEQSRKIISVDSNITSKHAGFEYLNDLFVKRHHKLLWASSKKIAEICIVLLLGILLSFYLKPQWKSGVNDILVGALPYFLFVMYAINRGTDFTRLLFMNCDHSLLTYSFYKKPGFVLELFQIRLKELIRINLLPASVISVGLAFLLWFTGGTENPLDYVVVIVSILCMSIFFSVHYLTIYYLLQPYNAGSEIKSASYQIVTAVTAFFCYLIMNRTIPTLLFGSFTILFCVVYCVIACVLVYYFAPKTFRIRA